ATTQGELQTLVDDLPGNTERTEKDIVSTQRKTGTNPMAVWGIFAAVTFVVWADPALIMGYPLGLLGWAVFCGFWGIPAFVVAATRRRGCPAVRGFSATFPPTGPLQGKGCGTGLGTSVPARPVVRSTRSWKRGMVRTRCLPHPKSMGARPGAMTQTLERPTAFCSGEVWSTAITSNPAFCITDTQNRRSSSRSIVRGRSSSQS